MFVTVVTTAVLLWPGTREVLTGLAIPRIPRGRRKLHRLDRGADRRARRYVDGALLRLLATRGGPHDARRLARLPHRLAASYAMTAVFGIAMMIIGSTIRIEGEGTQLLVTLSDRLGAELGPAGKLAVPVRHARDGLQQPARRLAGGALSVRRLLAAS